jgi:hypothetical protein
VEYFSLLRASNEPAATAAAAAAAAATVAALAAAAAAGMKYMRAAAGNAWTDYKTNTEIANELKISPVLGKIQ